jgi:hypothetical protein
MVGGKASISPVSTVSIPFLQTVYVCGTVSGTVVGVSNG